MKSATKSIGGSALGLAIGDGRVDLEDRAQSVMPGFGLPPAENANTGWLDDITVLQLATHTAGFDKTGGYINLIFQPGTRWSYSDGSANWLADTLTSTFAQDLELAAVFTVFSRLGITSSALTWRENRFRETTLNGVKRREFGSGISANVDAMARIGYLYLRRGVWDGQRLLPDSFVQDVQTPSQEVIGLPINLSGDFPNGVRPLWCAVVDE